MLSLRELASRQIRGRPWPMKQARTAHATTTITATYYRCPGRLGARLATDRLRRLKIRKVTLVRALEPSVPSELILAGSSGLASLVG